MDEQLILTGAMLRLNPALQRAVPAKGTAVLKGRHPGATYLTVSDSQWDVLRNFLNPITVPDVLRVLILRRAAIPLREFYELILKAHRAGVLITSPSLPDEEPRVWHWWRMPGNIFMLPAWAGAGFAFLWLALNGLPLPVTWQAEGVQVLLGWVGACVALTLGDFMAACVLSHVRSVAPLPHFEWRTVCPHFAVRLDDVQTLSRQEQVGVWSARLFPLAMSTAGFVGLAGHLWPSAALVPLLALLVGLRPFGGGILMPVLSALLRGEVLDTHKELLFSGNRRWSIRLAFGLKRVNSTYVFTRLAAGVLWAFFLVTLSLRSVGSGVLEVYSDAGYWRNVGVWLLAGVTASLAVSVAPPAWRRLRRSSTRAFRGVMRHLRWWIADVELMGSHAAILQTMAASLVFRRLSQASRLGLVVSGEVRRMAPWKTWGGTGQPVPVGMILSGRVVVLRSLRPGKFQQVAVFEEGDVIGSEPWTDVDGGAVQVRTLSPVILLEWTPETFGEKVVNELGVTAAGDLMVKVPFLRPLPLCCGWHPQAIGRFAQIARFTTFEPNHHVLAEGEAVLWFFILFTGKVGTRKRRGRRARLVPGDYFGEISLMRQDVATADVVTIGPARCLLIHRPEFLRFMTHNPFVALEVEEVSSKRFGRPVFPYRK
ncbi:MAG: cyclic nucleotide-binding domain-containing protein [Opitutaceae bacterium]|nr:cyclic nucleotide-binding domain-containing protein [Opitutaceae bacterium]